MNDGWGTGPGNYPGDGRQGDDDQPQQDGEGPEPRVLRGRIIPGQSKRPLPPGASQQPGAGTPGVPHQQPASGAPQWRAEQPPPQPPPPQPQQHRPPGPDRPLRREGEPDWDALAEANDARTRRRRRLLMIGSGVAAALAVAGIVATAVVATGDKPHPKDSTSGLPAQPELPEQSQPSFPEVTPPPPPNPLSIISSAEKDTAPLSTGTLFPGKRLNIGDRGYAQAATGSTGSCASVTQGGLGSVLAGNGCRTVLRATYLRDGVAVTVGVAVFDTAAAAEQVKKQATGNIASLSGGDVGTFCRPVACWRTSNAIGRYAYFTIAGPSDGRAAQSSDTEAKQAGRDAATFAFNRIVQRGKDAAAQGQ